MPQEPTAAAGFVTLARLLRPQGRKGELLADLLTDLPDQLTAPTGVYLVTGDAPAPDAARIVLESAWMPTGRNAGRVVVKLPGCDSIHDAEKRAGARLMLPAGERPALDADTFYISDLVGCRLYDRDTLAGVVVDVEFAMSPDGRTRLEDAPPLLCVSPSASDGDQPDVVLVPFARDQVKTVDLEARRIVMELPGGLFDPEP